MNKSAHAKTLTTNLTAKQLTRIEFEEQQDKTICKRAMIDFDMKL